MNANEMVKKIVKRTGVTPELAEVTLEEVVELVKNELVYPYSSLLKLELNGDTPDILLELLDDALKPPFDEADVQVVEQVLNRGIPADFTNPAGMSLLEYCALYNRVEIAPLLLERGAPVNKADRDGVTPLLAAVCGPNSVTMAELLLKHGAKHDIFSACLLGDLGTVTLFIYDNPQLVHTREPFYNETPLFKAVKGRNLEVVEVLLENGADANALDVFRQNPLHSSVYLGQVIMTEQLLKAGADVNQKSADEGRTPLDKALSHFGTCSPVVKLLREHGAKQGIDKRTIDSDLFADKVERHYDALGCGVRFTISEQGDRMQTFNIYPGKGIYYTKKIKDTDEPGAYEEAFDEIKNILFPEENVRIRRIYRDKYGNFDLNVELLDV